MGKVLAPKPQKSGRKGSKMGEGRPPDPGVACFYTSGGSVKKGPVVPSGMGTSYNIFCIKIILEKALEIYKIQEHDVDQDCKKCL